MSPRSLLLADRTNAAPRVDGDARQGGAMRAWVGRPPLAVHARPREMFEEMNRATIANGLRPVVDRVFGVDALGYLEAGAHFGKVAVCP